MKKIFKMMVVVAIVISLGGCSAKKTGPEFTKLDSICELATMKCYFHLVAKGSHDKEGILGTLVSKGYKKYWTEYTSTVQLGIDVSKVKIHDPDTSGTVVVEIPDAQVLGHPDTDETSFSKTLTDVGWLTDITSADKHTAWEASQNALSKTFSEGENSELLNEAKTRAETIIESYIKDVGEQIGETYYVKWEKIS